MGELRKRVVAIIRDLSEEESVREDKAGRPPECGEKVESMWTLPREAAREHNAEATPKLTPAGNP
jgi:hypothetical protein